MEEQSSPLSWAHYFYQEEDSLLYSTWEELEAALLSAHEEISRKEDEIVQLKDLLAKVVDERDEFKSKCHALALENQRLVEVRATRARKSPTEVVVDDENADHLSSQSDETNSSLQQQQPSQESAADSDISTTTMILCKKPLPENGKFLPAVMEAGPLLQTLLLAGPLPRWQHPPPQLSSSEIPPVVGIPSFASPSSSPTPTSVGFKRAHAAVSSAEASVPPNKYPKVVHHHHHHQPSPLTQLN